MFLTFLLLLTAVGLLAYGVREIALSRAATVRGVAVVPRILDTASPPRVSGEPLVGITVSRQSLVRAMPEMRTRALTLWLPVIIVGAALALRTIDLADVPHGFFCDEAVIGLDAYLIAHTLHDHQHSFLPIIFQGTGGWSGGLHVYWDVPFMMLFGLNEFATRLGSAVAGTLTVGLTYLFVSKAVNRSVGLLSALLLATSPWHLLMSRNGWECASLPFAVALSLTFLFYGLDRPHRLLWAFPFSALAIYTYSPARLFVPLLWVAWVILYRQELWRGRRFTFTGACIAGILLIPIAIAIRDGTFTARLSQLQGPPVSLHERLLTIWGNYLAHFQPSFLFDTSTDWITRDYVRGFGVLYGVEAPFLILGVITLIVRHRRADLLFLWWLLIYPIPTALVSPPFSHRSIAGVIVFQIAVAIGLVTVANGAMNVVRRLCSARRVSLAVGGFLAILLLAGVTTATGQFVNAYFNEYPKYSSGWAGWQSGAGDIIAYFEQNRTQYSRMLMTAGFNAPDVLLAFYTQTDPGACSTCGIVNWNDRDTRQRFYEPDRRELWALSPDEFSHGFLRNVRHRIVHVLRYPDGNVSHLFVATGPGT